MENGALRGAVFLRYIAFFEFADGAATVRKEMWKVDGTPEVVEDT